MLNLLLASGGGGAIILILFLLIAGFVLYFLPSLIAFNRGHHNRVAIMILNFFFGWTFLGWVVCLVWAATHIPSDVRGA